MSEETVAPWMALVGGAVAGCLDPITGQPLWTITRRMQDRDPRPFRPRGIYTGFWANVASIGPATAVQWLANETIPGDGVVSSFAAGWIAGVCVSAPTEQGVTVQQDAEGRAGFLKANRAYLIRRGWLAAFSGAVATGGRDGIYTIGMFYLAPLLQSRTKELCDQYRVHPWISVWLPSVAGGAVAGALASVISHPLATISQRQRGREKHITVRHAIRAIAAEGGFPAFWEGWKPRAVNCAISLITIPWIAERAIKVIKEKN